MPPFNEAPMSFLDLPAEIRLNIYSHFPAAYEIGVHHKEHDSNGQDLPHLPELRSFEAGEAITTRSADHHLDVRVHFARTVHFPRNDKQGTLSALSRVCRQIRLDVLPIIFSRNELYTSTFNSACWFGLSNLQSVRSIQNLIITDPTDNAETKVRWAKQLLKVFPNLRYLHIKDFKPSKNEKVWGTKWKLGDLRMMKFMKENWPSFQHAHHWCMPLHMDVFRLHALSEELHHQLSFGSYTGLGARHATVEEVDIERELKNPGERMLARKVQRPKRGRGARRT